MSSQAWPRRTNDANELAHLGACCSDIDRVYGTKEHFYACYWKNQSLTYLHVLRHSLFRRDMSTAYSLDGLHSLIFRTTDAFTALRCVASLFVYGLFCYS
jgi:hypothetical protein